MKRLQNPLWSSVVLLFCTLALATPAGSAANPDLALGQVRLTTSDGVRLDGIVYRPAAATPGASIGLLLVHGFGSNFYSAYFPYLGRAAAQHGMLALALNMRDHDTGPKTSDFTDNRADIAAGIQHLRSLGANRIVLLGQSMGTNRVLYYQAASADPAIAATVLVSGPGNLFDWNVWQFGAKPAQETVNAALQMQAGGHERELMLIDLGPLGKALYTPRYLLSLRGPNAKSDPYRNIQKVKNPILIVQGKADKLIEPDIAERLRKAAGGNPRIEVHYVDGADHGFSGQPSVLAERVLSWIDAALSDKSPTSAPK